ncbi:hypothetical protein [Chryseobacterium sp. JUb7]|uniref:hypothetical protein n=1 Tax=Chryseobacterium sp. JUb7 TaxID=2940599 RepID=UPI0021686337|nr:hypothetical protein [Chryseobacterium sp. JUb7]MCS3530840.1 hypothetical protein [Chryseobacterium sp. JUb7]
MSGLSKYILIGLVIFGSLIFLYFFIVLISMFSLFGGFDKAYSVEELKNEYSENEEKIDEVIQYFNKIKPQDKIVKIEFKDDNILERLSIIPKDKNQSSDQLWNVSVSDVAKSQLMKSLNWSEDDIKSLKEKLDRADCISVEDGEPMKIGFKRSGLGMYSFNIFQKKETERSIYNDGCQYILVNNKLALEYGGGAVGPQCFPGNKK